MTQPTPEPRPIAPDLVRGAIELETTERGILPHRLPAAVRAQNTDPQLAMVESQPSGVRLAFRTEASVIELDAIPTRRQYVGVPPRPAGVFDLRVDGALHAQRESSGGDVISIDMSTGASSLESAGAGTVRFDDLPTGSKHVELWLPHIETIELVELRADRPLTAIPSTERPLWLHHGSSISHGSGAASPSTSWPAIAASLAGVELSNLGFGGSALLDQYTARTMRDTAADLISIKMGINLVNADLMRMRGFTSAVHGFLDTIRDGHPTTPILVVSPIFTPIHEHTPGPGAFDPAALAEGRTSFIATGDPADVATGRLSLVSIRAELARIVAQRAATDPNLHYLDGTELYGEADFAEMPLPDQLHPDAASHRRIAERFAAVAFVAGGPLDVTALHGVGGAE